MVTGAAEALFLDTNVLIYANVASAPRHADALEAIRAHHRSGAELWTSRQVLREYLAALSRPQTFTSPRPVATLIERGRYFESRFQVAEDGPQVTARLLELMGQLSIGGKQVHDANIVATMQAHGVIRLLTANPVDFARFRHLVTVVPL
jgi:predicted nucleic acid-binding protein